MNKLRGLSGIIFTSVILITASATTQAQTMYRCGSAYQDRPCDDPQKGGKLVGGMSGSASPNGSVSDATCVQRGTAAQKIVWAREGGAMLDQQLAKASGANEKMLINDVYARRGTSSDIRAAIEADCMAAKEKAAQAAAMIEAARTGQPPAGSATSATSAASASKPMDAEQKAEAENAKENSTREAANKKIRCEYMTKQLETILGKQRAGGNAKLMDDLREQKQDVERRLGVNKC